MKWAREIKIGLLSVAVIVILIWGYKFLKGKNVFSYSNTYNIAYENIDQLTTSSPVMVNGFKVGMVTKIYLNPDNGDEVIVQIEVDGVVKLPEDTKAILYSVGIVGGKGIMLDFDKMCTENCLPSGAFIEGEVRGLLSSMVPATDVELYLQKLENGLGNMMDSMGLSGQEGESNSGRDLKDILANLASITARLDQVIGKSDASITQSIRDIQSFTGSLKQNEAHLNVVMSNLENISTQLAGAGVDRTIVKVDSTIGDLAVSVRDLKGVVKSAGNSFENIDQIIRQVEAGEGTLGKLLVQDSLYNELNMTIQHLNLLLQDLRINPKRYVNVSLIGRKNQAYEKLENDPAFEE